MSENLNNIKITRTLTQKRKLLEYYVLAKQLKFMDAVKDEIEDVDDMDAVDIYNDPFDEERQSDQMNRGRSERKKKQISD